MTDGRYSVLLAGLDDGLARRVVLALSALDLHFNRVPWIVMLAEPAWVLDSEVVIVRYEGDRSALEWLADCGGWSADGWRTGAVVALCAGNLAAEVEPFLERGISRVVPLEELDQVLRKAVSSLLGVAPRYRLRVPIRLASAAAAGVAVEAATTENLSVSGMLVSCPEELRVGSAIRFEMTAPGHVEPIRGTARIVRMTDHEREGVRGVGARFLSFLGSDRDRFDGLLPTRQQ